MSVVSLGNDLMRRSQVRALRLLARRRAMRAYRKTLSGLGEEYLLGRDDEGILLGKAKRKRAKGSIIKFIGNFRKMKPAERKAAWRKIPKIKRAALLLTAGPVILPLLAAAGVAVTATAAAAPMTFTALTRRIVKRKQKVAAAKRKAAQARQAVSTTQVRRAPAAQQARAVAQAAAAESEAATEQAALQADEAQYDDVASQAASAAEESFEDTAPEEAPPIEEIPPEEIPPEAGEEGEGAEEGTMGALVALGVDGF